MSSENSKHRWTDENKTCLQISSGCLWMRGALYRGLAAWGEVVRRAGRGLPPPTSVSAASLRREVVPLREAIPKAFARQLWTVTVHGVNCDREMCFGLRCATNRMQWSDHANWITVIFGFGLLYLTTFQTGDAQDGARRQRVRRWAYHEEEN